MRRRVGLSLAVPLFIISVTNAWSQSTQVVSQPAWLEPYRDPASRLIGEAVSSPFAWDRLSVLTDTIGNRLSGSPALDRAIQDVHQPFLADWLLQEEERAGLAGLHRAGDGALAADDDDLRPRVDFLEPAEQRDAVDVG